MSFEEALYVSWVDIGVWYEDGDVSQRDNAGATGALAKQIEGLGRRGRLYRCSRQVAGVVTETIA